jgi:Holliday junction resolvase RusA-like endonuclease
VSQRRVSVEEYRELAGQRAAGRAPARKRARLKQADYFARFMATPPAVAATTEEAVRQRLLFERHDNVVYQFRLPMPPSTNNAKAIFQPPKGRARLITTAEGRAYFEAVKRIWGRREESWRQPLTGRIRLLLVFFFRDRRRADISNRVKVLEDALTYAEVWTDDCQVDDGRQLRGGVDPRGIGYVDVVIEVIGG